MKEQQYKLQQENLLLSRILEESKKENSTNFDDVILHSKLSTEKILKLGLLSVTETTDNSKQLPHIQVNVPKKDLSFQAQARKKSPTIRRLVLM
jgi:hypothetical protein